MQIAGRKPDFVTCRWMCSTWDEAKALVDKVNAETRSHDGKLEGVTVVECSTVEWEEAGEERFAADVVLTGADLPS